MEDSYEKNNTKPVSRLRRILSNSAVRVIIAGFIVLSASFATYAAIDPHRELERLEDEYQESLAKVEFLAGRYNAANLIRCETEAKLANYKLVLHHKGTMVLEMEDFVRVSNKALWDCKPEGEAAGFLKNQ